MSSKTVYLAGPILGCTHKEANNWRDTAIRFLAAQDIKGISPLRCEPLMGERYALGNDADPRFGTSRAIASKNFMDVQRCDMTLCYFPPQYFTENKLSLGTVVELAWAHALRKPTILVTNLPRLVDHPVIQACASWVVPTLSDGLDVCAGVLGGY